MNVHRHRNLLSGFRVRFFCLCVFWIIFSIYDFSGQYNLIYKKMSIADGVCYAEIYNLSLYTISNIVIFVFLALVVLRFAQISIFQIYSLTASIVLSSFIYIVSGIISNNLAC